MSINKFLTYQFEPATGSVEKGLQIRASDPVSPIASQVWLNTVQKAVKIYDGSTVWVTTQGWPASYDNTGNTTIDANNGINFTTTISTDTTFTFNNFVSGMQWQIFITNSDVSNHTMTFPALVQYQDAANDIIINASTTNLFKFVYIVDTVYCIVTKNLH